MEFPPASKKFSSSEAGSDSSTVRHACTIASRRALTLLTQIASPPHTAASATDRTSDERWARQLRADDLHTPADAYRMYAPVIHRYALSRLRDPEDAADAVQATFVSAWHGRATYRPEHGPFVAWLHGIARHRIYALYQQHQRHQNVVGALVQQPHSGGRADSPLDRILVDQALDTLPPAQGRMVSLAYLHNLTHQQIAARTGTPPGHREEPHPARTDHPPRPYPPHGVAGRFRHRTREHQLADRQRTSMTVAW
ncbi:RNA polymerase sigma factor [Streptomyces sp. NPDC005047]